MQRLASRRLLSLPSGRRSCLPMLTATRLPQEHLNSSSRGVSPLNVSWLSQPCFVNRVRAFSTAVPDNDEDVGPPKKVIPFLLADIGEGIAEVELLQWFVAPGDHVTQFDRICEVQSDKATVEITSRYDGIVQQLDGQAGDMISVGTPLLHIAVADSTNNEESLNNVDEKEDRLHIPSLESKFELASDKQQEPTTTTTTTKVLTTPAVRKLAMDYDLDLGNIVGTGPKGRILKADVLKILKDSGVLQEEERPKERAPKKEHVAEDTTIEIKGYNRLMVKSMTASLQIPHMCYSDEIEMNQVLKCRQELKQVAKEHGIKKLSLLPFAIKAASLSMKEYPVLNSTLNAEEYKLTYRASHNIGVAMDTPRGLAVPVVKDCQNLSVLEIAQELDRLKKLAADGALSESDITDATFTLSNIGAIGGTYMSPIVSAPQVAIGAMGRVQRLPRFGDDNKVEEVHIMQISWGGDHRVVDGATMARFSNQWKAYMESPMTMVFAMK